MKKTILFILSLITLYSCDFPDPIPVEGCTDPNAINYNQNADINNNTCDFSANIIFYLDQNAGIYLYNEGVQKLIFHIDGHNIGSQYNEQGFYTSQVDPECFDPVFTTGTSYWSGNSSYKSIMWEVIDENGIVWFNASSQIEANTCLAIQLTSKNMKNILYNH